MKRLQDFIVENKNVLWGETFLDKNDLEKSFRELIDDAANNLYKEHNIQKTPKEIAEIVIKAMERYKDFS